MDQANDCDPTDPLGLESGRLGVLKDILTAEEAPGAVEGPSAESSDDDLDAWWGTVEVDRLASGLTLTAIGKLSEPRQDEDPSGPWIHKSDPEGNEPTQLTSKGRAAVRQLLSQRV